MGRRDRSAGGRRRAGALPALLLVAGCALAACGSPPATLRQQVAAWTSANQFAQAVGTLYGDAQHVSQVVRDGRGTGAIHTACAVLETDTGAVEENLPAPDLTMTDALNSAVTLDYQAGTDCFQGGGTNAALMRKSARLRGHADIALGVAVARAEQILGSTISTTTTTTLADGGT